MKYEILRTDKFNDQLNDIINYIVDGSGSIDTALSVLDRIEMDITGLRDFPDRGALPRYSILRRQGFRVLVVMRWLVFYKVNHVEYKVILYAITDQRQEYLNLV